MTVRMLRSRQKYQKLPVQYHMEPNQNDRTLRSWRASAARHRPTQDACFCRATNSRAHADRSNIQAGTSSQRSASEPLSLQRKIVPSALSIAALTPTQIWIAVCAYVLAAIIKQEMALEISLYTFLQILSVHSFEKTQLEYVFLDVEDNSSLSSSANQLRLFDN